jgi:hypothetical protein
MIRGAIFIVIAAIICTGGAYAALTAISLHRKEARVEMEATFFRIGHKVATGIREQQRVPRSAQDLRASGWLEASEWSFFEQNKLTYTSPGTNTSQETVILRMPYEGNAHLSVQLSGLMRKEYSTQPTPHDENN